MPIDEYDYLDLMEIVGELESHSRACRLIPLCPELAKPADYERLKGKEQAYKHSAELIGAALERIKINGGLV